MPRPHLEHHHSRPVCTRRMHILGLWESAGREPPPPSGKRRKLVIEGPLTLVQPFGPLNCPHAVSSLRAEVCSLRARHTWGAVKPGVAYEEGLALASLPHQSCLVQICDPRGKRDKGLTALRLDLNTLCKTRKTGMKCPYPHLSRLGGS